MTKKHDAPEPRFTLDQRFVFGNFALDEVLELKDVGRTRGYEDIATGRLLVEKHGRRVLVAGPVARLYLDGQPMPADPAAYVSAIRNGENPVTYEPLPVKELPSRRRPHSITTGKKSNALPANRRTAA